MRVAIVGCGQLARMLALSGIPLGIKFTFYADQGESMDTRCVDGLGDVVFAKEELLGEALYKELQSPDVITFEKEQVRNLTPIRSLAEFTSTAPSVRALEVCMNRHREKQLLDSLAIPSARYVFVDSSKNFESSVKTLKYPAVVKSVTEGYDGKNQWRIFEDSDIAKVPENLISQGVIIEEWISFNREVSVLAVRNEKGEIKTYPLTENKHQNGILISSVAPADNMDQTLEEKAKDYITKILNELSYVGVLTMECFVTDDNVLVNELAPRVHNSGHWTQNGAVTSQFENHLRAVTGLALGSTENHANAGMVNILGPNDSQAENLNENTTLHWYGKTIRPGRKLGHVNFLNQSRALLLENMDSFQENLLPQAST